MITKRCPKCGEVKPLDCFSRDSCRKNGLRVWCKECCLADRRKYREYNRDKVNAAQRRHRAANREKIRSQDASYYAANRRRVASRKRAHYELVGNPTVEKWQEISEKYADRAGEPWSEEEDNYLIASTNRDIDDALVLRRTYNSVRGRRRRLLRAGLIEKQSA